MAIDDELRAAAEAWIAEDPDPATRAEARRLLEDGDEHGLADRFSTPLAFGTAGMRGPLGAGPGRMNRAVVRRVSAGLAEWLRSRGTPGEVVVGRDARHGSAALAEETVRVLAGAGVRVRRFDRPVPTPLVAFAVRTLGAAAGVQITASHNPPSDNGYKVYVTGGLPLAPPHDAEIAAASAVGRLADVPLAAADDPRITPLPSSLRDSYLKAVHAAAGVPVRPHRLRLVVTPLHGVAGALLLEALAGAGFTDVTVVPEQADPDPDFPTTPFPNPEEPGTLDLALALGRQRGAQLVLATDPDGDRIAVGVPLAGGWRALTGDEVGCLLADHLLEQGRPLPGRPLVATTVVSSRLLAKVAEAHGAVYAETLTGFKWLAPVADDASPKGLRFVLAYEQALGVMLGDAVRDKDGIAAALAFAGFATVLAARGATVEDALEELARRHNVHATAQRSLRVEGATQIARVLDGLRADPPRAVAGVAVASVADHAAGLRSDCDGTTEVLGTPAADLFALTLADGSRCLVRPSGTEPLLKFYLEAIEEVGADGVTAARARATERVDRLGEAFVTAAGG